MALRTVPDVLAQILDDRRRDDARHRQPSRVVGRNVDGTINRLPLNGECVVRDGVCSVYEGQIIEGACTRPFELQGAAGISALRSLSGIAALDVTALDPDFYEGGESYTVAVTGRGFRAGLAIDLLQAPGPEGEGAEEVNADVEVLEVRVFDSETAEMDITVAAGAPPIDAGAGGIAFDIVGAVM